MRIAKLLGIRASPVPSRANSEGRKAEGEDDVIDKGVIVIDHGTKLTNGEAPKAVPEKEDEEDNRN